MTRQDGALVTCAGDSAILVPVTPATRTRLRAIYGAVGAADLARVRPVPSDRWFAASVARAACEADGSFRFANLADGRYYVIAPLRAEGEGARQGIAVREEVALRGGETRSVMLAH